MITVERNVHFGNGRRSRKELREGDAPRESTLWADSARFTPHGLAIRLDGLIRDGVVTDHAELARLGHVTRARLTQIINLLQLALEIQEAIPVPVGDGAGQDVVTEKQLRPMAGVPDWGKRRRMWGRKTS